MARERQVTRTINTTDFTVIVMDTATMTGETMVVSIPSADTMTDSKLDKALRSAVPTGKLFVSVAGKEKREVLYAMSEAEFIKLAKVVEGGR